MTPRQITHSQPGEWTGVEYATVCPFNADNSRLLLVRRDHFGLWDGDGNFIQDLNISSNAEPRWSRKDPKVLWYLLGWKDNRIMKYVDGKIDEAHTFPEYVGLSGKGESDISIDNDHLALCGTRHDGGQEVFVVELSTGHKGEVFPQVGTVDGLRVTAKNQPVVSRESGIFVLESGGARQIAPVNGHACLGQYQGREVLVWCSAADPKTNANAVVRIDIDTGHQHVLHVFDWKYSFHESTCSQNWFIVSTECPDRSLPSQVWKVYYDDSKPAELIVEDTGSLYTGYNSQVKAALSRDGSLLVGCSNFGKTDDPNYCDVFLLNLEDVKQTPDIHTRTRIDYSQYVGKSQFVMVPRSDGSVDIYEEKL